MHAADHYVQAIGISTNVFETMDIGEQNALKSLGLGERLPQVLSEFESEFAAIKPYF